MFGDRSELPKLHLTKDMTTTILDKDASFEGKLTFEGTVVINGQFKGEIFSNGHLVIGQGGLVEGKIDIGSILIEGEVRGNIHAKEKIEVNAPAIVQGDISAPSLVMKEGAVFEGNCSMGKKENNIVEIGKRNMGTLE